MNEKSEKLKQDELFAMLMAVTVLLFSLFLGTMNARTNAMSEHPKEAFNGIERVVRPEPRYVESLKARGKECKQKIIYKQRERRVCFRRKSNHRGSALRMY